MAGFLKAGDTIAGNAGTATATIGSETFEMFMVRNLRATATKNKADVRVLGNRNTQKKATGWEGAGTMTIYYVTSRFREMMYDYIQNGKDTYFDIQITNEDPTSATGKQIVTLLDVNLDEVVMAALDTEAETLDEEVSFTFQGVDLGTKFTAPTLG